MATISSIFGIKSSHSSKHHPHVLQSASSSTSSMTPLTLPASASDDRNFAALKELASISANRNCFDCLQRGPTYVNMTIGSFVCTSCSGKLRGLNPPHRVKSISMAVFSDEEIDILKNRGNDFCQKVWLGRYPGPLLPLEKENDSKLMDILTARYERKCWYVAPSESMYDEARKKVESELNKKNKTTVPSCKTSQAEQSTPKTLTSSNMQTIHQQPNRQMQFHLTSYNMMNFSTSSSNLSASKQPTVSLSSSPFVRSPLKTFSPVTPQSLSSVDSPKFSFQAVTTEFADFANFSSSSPIFSSPSTTPLVSAALQPLAFNPTGTPQNFANPPTQHFYYNVSQYQPSSFPGSTPQDKYAPLHDLTRDMESLSINWNGHHMQTGSSSQQNAWKNSDQFVSDAFKQCTPHGGGSTNPFIEAIPVSQNQLTPASNQFQQNQAEQCLSYPGYVPSLPLANNSFNIHIPASGLNQLSYDNMVYHQVVSGSSLMHKYNYQNSPHTGFMYQPPYYYQSYPQYNPSNPFLNQAMETQTRGTNPFL